MLWKIGDTAYFVVALFLADGVIHSGNLFLAAALLFVLASYCLILGSRKIGPRKAS